MTRWLGRFDGPLYAILRIVMGFMFACHGAQKLLGAFGGPKVNSLGSQMGVAGLIELVGGTLIVIGLFASWAAFLASGEMAVAYFTVHFPGGALPITNHGEMAVANCFVFLYIAARGAGMWSVARASGKKSLD